MSLSITFYGEREIIVKKTGRHDIQRVYIPSDFEWRIPAKDVYSIVNSRNPVDKYMGWIERDAQDEWEDVYDYDSDPLNPTITGQCLINRGKVLIEDFQQWIENMEAEGFSIKCGVM